jgi:hypothetical protein
MAEESYLGFRIAYVVAPEPDSMTLLIVCAASLFAYAWA